MSVGDSDPGPPQADSRRFSGTLVHQQIDTAGAVRGYRILRALDECRIGGRGTRTTTDLANTGITLGFLHDEAGRGGWVLAVRSARLPLGRHLPGGSQAAGTKVWR
jgi:hypothetical protein